jgi:signal transduction histidine kinase
MLAWLGARMLAAERAVIRHQFTELLTARLRDTDQIVAGLLGERERQLMRATDLPSFETEPLRELVRKSPLISQIFVIDSAGNLVHPPPAGAISTSENEFLHRAKRLLLDKELIHGPAGPDKPGASGPPAAKGWYVWYWEDGLSLIFWRRVGTAGVPPARAGETPAIHSPAGTEAGATTRTEAGAAGHIVAVELERARLLADIIARLPGSETNPSVPPGQIALLDSNGAVIHQWGEYEPAEGERPRVDMALSPPLSAWHWRYYVPERALSGTQAASQWSLLVGLLVAGVVLLALGVYFYSEYSRDVRQAAQRVNFVNQVSHELRTPLTNIRMYAELLEGAVAPASVPAGNEQTNRYLKVIVTESERLSRLIANVLTFARQQRQTLTLRPQPGSVDEVIGATVEQFRPALEAKGVAITVQRGAAAEVLIDKDALGQVLGNLIGNVEKYGSSGGVLEIASSQADGVTRIVVADRGPGISEAQREKIFEPFYRVSDKLSDGVTGTGIGLSIARELARLHGGNVTLERSEAGARFCVTVSAPVSEQK